MSVNVSFANVTYPIPNTAGESGWASLTDYLVAIAANAATTGAFRQAIRVATSSPVTVTVTDTTVVTNLAVAGPVAVTLPAGAARQIYIIVDGKGDAATNNITVTPSGGQQINGAATFVLNANAQGTILQFDGTQWRVLINAKLNAAGTIVDSDISASAAIALSKLATGALPTAITIASANIVDGSIVNADIDASAAIAFSKLATGALPAAITIDSSNIVDGSIVNADISASAGITDSKLNTISTSGKVANSATSATPANSAFAIAQRDGSGNFEAGTITAALVGNATTATTATFVSGTVGTGNGGTGINSSATFPASGVVATRAAAETLTNKTLTSPVINSPTGIVKADVGLANVDNTSDATKNSASVTLTNKTLTSPTLNTPTQGTFEDWTHTTTPIAPAAGQMRAYAKSDNKLYIQTPAGGETALLRVGDAGGGDVVGPASSVDSEIALFSSTTGKVLKRATGTGYAKVTSGVLQTPVATIPAADVLGRTDGSSPAAGYIGERLRSAITSLTNFPATFVVGDLTSITLTPGVWDISVVFHAQLNGAGGMVSIAAGVSSTIGNSFTGLNAGDNLSWAVPPTATSDVSISISQFRVLVASNTPYYLKFYADYSSGTPRALGRISAVRIA